MLRWAGFSTCIGNVPHDAPSWNNHLHKRFILRAVCGYPATRSSRSYKFGRNGAPVSTTQERENGSIFMPKFDDHGLLTAVVVDAASGAVLMVAFMDEEALEATRKTGQAHFHSRSRGRLWKKGESSGHVLEVNEMLVDCDQDALVLRCTPAGPTCHTGAASCFYRVLDDGVLQRVKT
ncbi:phosphoribosyl-AMP cyclohydrolase [Erythrobacter mangrovi]|uniref:Phosphoribosyl-AMP cyclohydrolase n=2 Tax=Erythrobacter mangrovi TaxID=2739433 RepID=A0A7D3XE27_9SPHN|nr:phosphoribosyl-AMP cyclohydrolase [Erythrobacter mangrovi]